jgi:hypothetical protein
MEMLFAWFMLSISVGILGMDRKLGFVKAMLLSLVLSPVGGVIAVLLSKQRTKTAEPLSDIVVAIGCNQT